MEPEQASSVSPSMTYDEVSMEHSKNFVKALQELKNLKPQLYSAAEYCEKSYLHSEQKQMVLGNLKDYAVRALVNAVDHLGTVAFKLNDLLDQKTNDVSAMELDVSFLNQRLMTCHLYTEKEGVRQQQLFSIIPRHHKHYVLPNAINKKVHFSPQIQTDTRQSSNSQARPRIFCPSGTPASKPLSWHLATETRSTLEGTHSVSLGNGDTNTSGQISGLFNLSRNDEKNVLTKSSTSQTIGALQKKDSVVEGSKKLNALRSFDKPKKKEVANPPIRSKSVLSVLFPKQKASRKSVS